MKTYPSTTEAVEDQWGQKIARELTLSNQDLPHDISERLRIGRQNAVQRLREQQQFKRVAKYQSAGGQAIAVSETTLGWWGRAGAVLPAVLLVLGLVGISELHDQSRAVESAKIDLALLTDELPPAAYSDPGFIRFATQHNVLNTQETVGQ